MIKIITMVIILSVSLNAFSAPWISSSRGRDSSGGGRTLSGIKLRALGGLKLEHGTFGSKDNSTVKERQMNGIALDVIAGINLGPLLLGVGADGHKYLQQTEAKKFNDTNLSGTLINYSGVAGIAFGKLLLLGKYYFKSDYKLDKKTTTGESVTYSSPDSSIGASLLWRPGGKTYWSIDYMSMTFKKTALGGSSSSLNSDTQMALATFGITYGIMF